MTSQINATRPTDTAFYAGDLRNNLATARDEITALQTDVTGKIGSVSADLSPDLGGNLNVNDKTITTLVTNGNVTLAPAGAGVLLFNSDEVQIGKNLRHIGDTDTKLEFSDAGDTILIITGGAERISITNLGTRLGGTGVRVTEILDDDAMTSDSAAALATQQSIKAYVDANAGIPSLSADTTPDLGGPLNGAGHAIINYTQPRVNSVAGTLTQASHGGRPCHITGTVSIPNTDGFVCELRNKSGSAKTINPISGNLIHEGSTKVSISLPNNRSVVVAGDGADIWVYGALV